MKAIVFPGVPRALGSPPGDASGSPELDYASFPKDESALANAIPVRKS